VSVDIRHGTVEDAAAVLALWAASDAVPSATDDVAGIEALLARDPDALLLAEEEGRMVGSLVVGWDGWRACMYRLAVAPDARRSGIASRLVSAGEEQLRAAGARRIHLIVVAGEDVPAGFWRSAGYTHDADRARYIKNL
jgi:ribosomal protein S18 acetylase RimI-like enzyme